MKKLQKIMLSLIAALVLIAVIKVPSQASVQNFTEKSCTENSITFSWNWQTEKATVSQVSQFTISSADGLYSKTVSNTATSATFTGLPRNYGSSFTLSYTLTYSFGSYTYTPSTYANTLPSSVAKNNFGVSSVLVNTNKVSFGASVPTVDSASSGVVLELYKGNTKVGTYTFSSSSNYISIAANKDYKYRVKYYFKNYSNGKTYYSRNWSVLRHFDLAKASSVAKSTKKGCTLTLKKGTNVTKYAIYISKTSSTSGFKKYKVVKMGSAKKKKVAIKSKYKKRTTNYIKIVPYIKGYGYSDISTVYSQYIYK